MNWGFPLISQVALLLIGLIVPVGIPALKGLDFYGQFVSATASAFLIQRLADFPGETLTFQYHRRGLLARSTALHIAFFVGAVALSTSTTYRINLTFLLGLQCSSIAFGLVIACRQERLTLMYLTTFLATYLIAITYALSSDAKLELAISIPNYASLVWIPLVLRLPEPAQSSFDRQETAISFAFDLSLRVAGGSFIALATLGLASVVSSGPSEDAAQVRLLGTALGLAGFLLPWPLKSLIGVLQAADKHLIRRLLRYLRGARLLATLLVTASLFRPTYGPMLLSAGVTLMYLNLLVIERWNVTRIPMRSVAGTALLASVATLVSFDLQPVALHPITRSSVAILVGITAYAGLTWRNRVAPSDARVVAIGLTWMSAVCVAALLMSQKFQWR